MKFNSQYYSDSWRLFRNHIVTIIALSLLFFVAKFVSAIILNSANLSALRLLLDAFLEIIYRTALILLLLAWTEDRYLKLTDSIKQSPTFFIALFPVFIVVHILGLLGLLAFIVPGLLVFSRLAYAQFLVIAERYDPIQALKKSIEATEKNYMEIIFTAIIPWVVVSFLIPWTIMVSFPSLLAELEGNTPSLALEVFQFGFLLVQVYFVFLLFRFYYAFREENRQ